LSHRLARVGNELTRKKIIKKTVGTGNPASALRSGHWNGKEETGKWGVLNKKPWGPQTHWGEKEQKKNPRRKKKKQKKKKKKAQKSLKTGTCASK